MKINRIKLNKLLKDFDEKSDYCIVTCPSVKDRDKIISSLDNFTDLFKKNGLEKRAGSYIHMTQIYMPAIVKINKELQEINNNAKIKKSELVGFIKDVLDKNYPDEKYIFDNAGILGTISVSLWAPRIDPPVYVYSFKKFKELFLNSGLNEKEFNQFVKNAQFSFCAYYKDQKYLPHISIAKILKYPVPHEKQVLDILTKHYNGFEIVMDSVELKKN